MKTGKRKGGRRRGRPKGSRNKKTIARRTALKVHRPRPDSRDKPMPMFVAVFNRLQMLAVGPRNEDAARLLDQISAALEPAPPDEPDFYIIVPPVMTESEWEAASAVKRHPLATRSLVERMRLVQRSEPSG